MKQKLKNAAVITLGCVAILAVYGWMQQRDLKEKHKAALEPAKKIIKQCLSGSGQPIRIGDEWYLCGIGKLGIKA